MNQNLINKNYLIIAITILIVLMVGGYAYTKSQKTSVPIDQLTNKNLVVPSSSTPTPDNMTKENIVSITSTGFNPSRITIKSLEMVTWVNNDTVDHQINSDVHPTHLLYPPLNLGLLKPGEKKSLSFPTEGTFRYHDHLNPSMQGGVIVGPND